MHVLLTSQYFPPETGALAARAGDHARRWVAAGARVTVLAGTPNYPTGEVPQGYRRRRWVVEDWHGVRVLRVPVLVGRYERASRRAANYLSYALSAVLTGALRVERPDVVLGTSPPPTAAAAAAGLAARFGVPFVLEERDPWPESLLALDVARPPGVVSALGGLVRGLRARAAHVVTVTPEMRAALVDGGLPAARVSAVPNGVDLDRFHPAAPAAPLRERLQLGAAPLVGHVGTIGHGQDLGTLVEAAARLPESLPLRVVLVGDGVHRASLVQKAARRAPGRFVFLPPRAYDEVPGLLNAFDVVLVSSRWSEVCERTVPTKLYEAMACGRPVLFAGRGAAADLVERAGAGLVVPPGEPRRLAEALSAMVADGERRARLGAAGPDWIRRHHDRDALAARMLEILEEVHRGD